MRDTPVVAAPPVLVAIGSHVGQVRANNEDRVYADPERGGFAVIDGVGGQAAGEHAAQTALDTIRQRLQLQIGTPAERVREAIALANDQIYQQAQAHPDRRGMACVLTLVLLQNGTLTAGHVGDTRLYKMRGGTLRKLTHDHSPIGEREDRGELTESEAMRHPRRNEVYREVGAEPHGPDEEGFIEVIEEPFEPDAALLLCSDGLSDVLSSAAIAGIIERHAGEPTQIVDRLIDRANEAGGKDNISVVYIEGAGFTRSARAGAVTNGLADGAGADSASAASLSNGAIGAPTGAVRNNAGVSGAARTGAAWTGADRTDADRRGTSRSSGVQSESAGAGTLAMPRDGSASARATSIGRTLTTSGVLAFVGGLLVGVAIALGVAYAMRDVLIPRVQQTTPGPRTLVVSPSGASGTTRATAGATTTFRTIGEAMAAARPGDTVHVGRGEYREQVVVPDGVALIATVPREVVLRAPAQALQPFTAVIVSGAQRGSRVSGLRIAGDAQAPVTIGVHVLGRAALDDLDISGATLAGIESAGGTLSLSSSAVHDNAGVGLALKGGDARLVHNVMLRNGTAVTPAPNVPLRAGTGTGSSSGATSASSGIDVVLIEAPHVTFLGNVFGGDPMQRIRGLAADQLVRFRDTNIVLPPPAPPPAPRPRAGTSRRPPR